jgi:DNA (cytosine-5)-methyltransferase 1
MTRKRLRVLDLFSGIGGWSLAAHNRGLETIAACEIDDWKRAQYAAHFPTVALYRDVRELTAELQPSSLRKRDCENLSLFVE